MDDVEGWSRMDAGEWSGWDGRFCGKENMVSVVEKTRERKAVNACCICR